MSSVADRSGLARDVVVFPMRHATSHVSVDLFAEYPLPFDGLWQRSIELPLQTTVVRVASIDDLITIKQDAGRPKDLLDVERLKDLKRLQQEGGLP